MAPAHKTNPSQKSVKSSAPAQKTRATANAQTSRASSVKQASAGIFTSAFEAILSSRVALVIAIILILAALGCLVDFASNYGRAYKGVSIGDVDVSGMNASEIEDAVSQEYASRLSSAGVTIYANPDALNDRGSGYDYLSSEEISVEEARALRRAWPTDSASLQAYIDYDALINEALRCGRENPLERIDLFFNNQVLDVPVNFNEAIVESIAHEIDLSIGEPLQNYDVEIVDGYVAISEGYDGNMVNRDTLKANLAQQLLSPDADNRAFVVETEHTPVQIDRQSAQATADRINAIISDGIQFECEGRTWLADAATLGSWIQTPLTRLDNGDYVLAPSFAIQAARASVLGNIAPHYTNGEGHIRFSKTADEIVVRATSEGTFPLVGEALENLNISLFSDTGSADEAITKEAGQPLRVELGTADIPESMTLEEALSFGIISAVSEFETEYTSGAFERNTNIHLAADLLDNSIISANGGVWSFNDTAGECNAEKGFLEARAVSGNTLIDEIGGGICQVATTVFNAVYEAGYPIIERHNHSIYFSSYIEGRDAAISWPSPDLKWENNSPSDLLLVMSYTDSTVKAILYGEDMGYIVESEQGEIQEGTPFTTVYETDETLYPGAEYVRVYGYDGHSVTVTRNVYDPQGELLITDYFSSVYSPQNTIIVRGPSS